MTILVVSDFLLRPIYYFIEIGAANVMDRSLHTHRGFPSPCGLAYSLNCRSAYDLHCQVPKESSSKSSAILATSPVVTKHLSRETPLNARNIGNG